MNIVQIRKSDFIKTFSQLRERGILTDIVFNVGSTKIHAHKLVLVAGSKYFERLFLGSFKDNSTTEIDIEIPIETFTNVIRILYRDYIPTYDKAFTYDLVRALNYFDVSGIDTFECWKEFIIPSEAVQFKEYVIFTSEITNGRLSEDEMMRWIAASTGENVDLAEMDDRFITTLLLTINTAGYDSQFTSIRHYYDIIVYLVSIGHSPDLWNILNYNRLPRSFQTAIDIKYPRQKDSMIGPIPKLWDHMIISANKYGLMYIDDGYRVVDADGSIYIVACKFERNDYRLQQECRMVEGDIIYGTIDRVGHVPADANWEARNWYNIWDNVSFGSSSLGQYYVKKIEDHTMYQNTYVMYITLS
jgi:hypothetical protein